MLFVKSVPGGALALLILAWLGWADPAATRQTWNFESDPPHKTATGFSSAVGRWVVVTDQENQVLAQQAENRDSVFNVALIDGVSIKNIDLTVRMKGVAGENERGGGLVFRAKDKDNYYALRYNPYAARHNGRKPSFRLYKVEDGKLTQLDHADAAAEPPDDPGWHTLRVTMQGPNIVGHLDGKQLLEAEDTTFSDVGTIGLWTRSDARSYFDDLTLSPFPAMRE